ERTLRRHRPLDDGEPFGQRALGADQLHRSSSWFVEVYRPIASPSAYDLERHNEPGSVRVAPPISARRYSPGPWTETERSNRMPTRNAAIADAAAASSASGTARSSSTGATATCWACSSSSGSSPGWRSPYL